MRKGGRGLMRFDADADVTVFGPFACFTRPETKAERVSYPVMTPSAARGILEAIFWRPEFTWQVREIHVLRPIRFLSLVRNELGARQDASRGPLCVEDQRQLRQTLALADVAYRILAEVVLRPHATQPKAKYRDQFRRRVARGQCHHTPYLGLREFAAFFGVGQDEQPVPVSQDLGWMLGDLCYEEDPDGPTEFVRWTGGHPRRVRGRVRPVFFRAYLQGGVLSVPESLYEEARAC